MMLKATMKLSKMGAGQHLLDLASRQSLVTLVRAISVAVKGEDRKLVQVRSEEKC